MLDFLGGMSIYNYALGTFRTKTELESIFKTNKQAVIDYINKTLESPWSQKAYKMIEMIIDEAEIIR